MSRSLVRQTLAVVVALAVACSFVGAPVAAATVLDSNSSDDTDGTTSGSQLSLTSEDGDDDASGDEQTGTDDETDDEAGDDEAGDDESETDGDAEGDASSGDDATDDGETSSDDTDDVSSSDDRTLRGDDDSTTGDGDRGDRVTGAVNATLEESSDAVEPVVDELENASAETLEGAEGVVSQTTEDATRVVPLDGLVRLSTLEFVVPLASSGADAGDTYYYADEPSFDAQHEEPPVADGLHSGATHGDETTEVSAGGSGDGDRPSGPEPGSGAVVGLGAVATAAALRGSPVVSGARAASSSGLLSTLLEKVRPFVLPLRYSRYDDSDPLEHEARERVYEIVNETPGSYLSAVSQEADLPLSTTRHHIKVLEREDMVTGAKLHGKRRFYPAYAEGIELSAALNDESTANIIDAIARIGAASVSDLADEIDRDPSTISHHLQRLEEDGVITRERDGRAVVSRLSAEARTALEPETPLETGEASEAVVGGAD